MTVGAHTAGSAPELSREGPVPEGPVQETTGGADDPEVIAAELERARARTLALVDLTDADQRAQHSPLMSPMVWDLAHIGNYEEQWLLRAIDGREPTDPDLDGLYDAFVHARSTRSALPILGPDDARAYDAAVRTAVLELLHDRAGSIDFGTTSDPLLRGGFVYGMVIQHEHQHDETLLATRQLMLDRATPPPGSSPSGGRAGAVPADRPDDVLIPGGTFVMGTDRTTEPWAYDNECGPHEVELAPFRLDTVPVTSARYLEFMADGGYHDARHWSPDGWAWVERERAAGPLFWKPEGDGAWSVLRFGRRIDLADVAHEPVQHVCFHEAEAFARWVGRRLPTEAEWERAARWDTATATSRRYPWGDGPPTPEQANLGQRLDGPTVAGSLPAGASPDGVLGLIGDVWEWTSSPFLAYPGFEPYPYPEYSEVFWGDEYRVLRGGSWAADATAVRGTFRNWDLPIRRQIFTGFRCARDA